MNDFFQKLDFEDYGFAIKILHYCKTQAKFEFLSMEFFAILFHAKELSWWLKE